MWDVIVVGARCAGAATALRFARSGRSVLVLDKAPYGSDTLSTHILIPEALGQLQSLGLLEQVVAAGSPAIHYRRFEFCDSAYLNPLPEPPHWLMNVRRTTLDPILVKAAFDAGAAVRHQVHVESLIWEDGRAVGVKGRDQSGAGFEERARLIVGADGRHSTVGRVVQPREYNNMECTTGAIYAYYEGIRPSDAGGEILQIAFGPQCLALCCPTDGGLFVVMLIVGTEEFNQMPVSDPRAFEARLRTIPTLAPRLEGARRAGKLHPAGPREVRGYFRQPYGPGWALVGDAGAVPHPALGHGIADALRSSELLYQFVEAAWAAGEPAEARLGNYQRIRDAENTGPYYFSYRISKIDPWRDPEVVAMLSGQGRNQTPDRPYGQPRPAVPAAIVS